MENPECRRCGIALSVQAFAKSVARGNPLHECASCRAKAANFVGSCRPWQGDFADDQITPMRNGQPYKPGKRLCGNADCVTEKHIEKPFDFWATYDAVMSFQYGPDWKSGRFSNVR